MANKSKPLFVIQLESGGIFACEKDNGDMDGLGSVIGADGYWGDEERPISRMLEYDILAWQRIYEAACSEAQFWAPDMDIDWALLHKNGLNLACRIKEQLGDAVRLLYERPIEDPDANINGRFEILAGGEIIQLPNRPPRK